MCSADISCVCSNVTVHPFTQVVGPSAWYADQYRHSTEHIYNLTTEDIAELDVAVAAVLSSGRNIQVRHVKHEFAMLKEYVYTHAAQKHTKLRC